MRDFYDVLDVPRDADPDTIKKAYRRLALKHHPDRNGGSRDAEGKFKEATEAYEVLREPEKRAAYDRFGHAGVKTGAGGGFAGFAFEDALNVFMRDFGGFAGFDDLFGGGGRQRRGTVQRGKDIRIKLPISLADVSTGIERKVRVSVLDPCRACNGTGSEDSRAPVSCETCGGAGEVRRVQRSMFGQLVTAAECPACHGQGRRIQDPCKRCNADGRERVERTFDVKVPPGVATGNYLTLRGEGSVGQRGGQRGDILVMLEVEADERFIREGDSVIYDLPLSFAQAALGAEVEVPTVLEEETLRIPGGTQNGDVLTLKGRGLPRLGGGGQGDQYVRVHVWTPLELTPEQEALFRQLAEIEGPAPNGKGGRNRAGFWGRVKEALGA